MGTTEIGNKTLCFILVSIKVQRDQLLRIEFFFLRQRIWMQNSCEISPSNFIEFCEFCHFFQPITPWKLLKFVSEVMVVLMSQEAAFHFEWELQNRILVGFFENHRDKAIRIEMIQNKMSRKKWPLRFMLWTSLHLSLRRIWMTPRKWNEILGCS